MTDPLGLQTIYGYDSDGNRSTVKDPMSRVTTTAFDAMNRPTVVIDPLGNRTTTTYDGDGEVIEVTDPMGRATTYDLRQPGLGRDCDRPAGQRDHLLVLGDRQAIAASSTTAAGRHVDRVDLLRQRRPLIAVNGRD